MQVNSIGYNTYQKLNFNQVKNAVPQNNDAAFTGNDKDRGNVTIPLVTLAALLGTATLPSCIEYNVSANAKATAYAYVNLSGCKGHGHKHDKDTIIIRDTITNTVHDTIYVNTTDTIKIENDHFYVKEPRPDAVWDKNNDYIGDLLGRPISRDSFMVAKKYYQDYLYDNVEEKAADRDEWSNTRMVYDGKHEIQYGNKYYAYDKILQTVVNGRLRTTLLQGAPSTNSANQEVYDAVFVYETVKEGNNWVDYRLGSNGQRTKWREITSVERNGDGIVRIDYKLYDENGVYIGDHDFQDISIKLDRRPEEWRPATPEEIAEIKKQRPDLFAYRPREFDYDYKGLREVNLYA